MSGLFKRERFIPLLKAFLLALAIFAAGAGLMIVSSAKSQMAVFILTVTTLSIIASLNKRVRETERTYDLGIYFILVFSIVVASKVNPEALSAINSNIFMYVTFVPIIAGSLRNKEIIILGMTVGIIGYTIGNYLGYLMALLLISFDYL